MTGLTGALLIAAVLLHASASPGQPANALNPETWVQARVEAGLKADRAEFAAVVWLDGDRITGRVTSYSAVFHNDFFMRRGQIIGDFAAGDATMTMI